MPVPRRPVVWTAAVLSGAGLAFAGLSSASGPPPVERGHPPPGVTAIGVGRAGVDATSRDPEPVIRQAVAEASARAMPAAMAGARRRAEVMADAAGVRLGRIWSVSQDGNLPYYGSGIDQGTFGADAYCGTVRRRRASGGYTRRRACRAPAEARVYLTVTFAQAE